jgi:glycosyltransferase involved in cell wall biosynthesis
VSAEVPLPPLRVLHCPTVVGCHPSGLARAERELGLDSASLVVEPPPYDCHADIVLAPLGTSRLGKELRRWRFLLRRLRTYDVVHFNFGSTLLPRSHPQASLAARLYGALVGGRDVGLLPPRTAVFVTYQGDDARQASERFASLPPGYFNPAVDAAKQRWISKLTRRADGIFTLNPDLLDVLPERTAFLPYASVDPRHWTPAPARSSDTRVVVHAPSDRAAKGTDHIVRAVERLRAEGISVELVLVEGMTRSEARAEYELADIVVDQLVSGWYGGIAVEAMALAKPVVARIAPEDLARVPADFAAELPVVPADVASVESVLRGLLQAQQRERQELGQRGRAFVERWHDPRVVAQTTTDAYASALRRRAMTTTSTNSPSR